MVVSRDYRAIPGRQMVVSRDYRDMFRTVDDSLAHLEAGLALDWKPGKRR
jgi:hypothetical protein